MTPACLSDDWTFCPEREDISAEFTRLLTAAQEGYCVFNPGPKHGQPARATHRTTPAPARATHRTTPAPAARAGSVASVPFMITRTMRAQLLAQGVSQERIRSLTPAEAQELLQNKKS